MSRARLLAWGQRLFGASSMEVASADTSPPLGLWESPERAIAFGHRIVIFGVLTFFVWATLAPLDEGIPASGAVAVESGRVAVSPLVPGRVASVSVTENQRVKAGEVLVTLENFQPQAVLDMVRQQHFAMAAKLARLDAEQRRDAHMTIPDDLVPLDSTPWAQEILASEVQLLTSRNGAFESEMAILRERIAAGEERLKGTRQQLSSRQQQYELLNEQVKGLSRLVEAGHTPRNQLLENQRNLVEIGRLVGELETSVALTVNSISELRLQMIQRRVETQRDQEAQIVDARRDLAMLNEKLKVARDDFGRTVIKAPIEGQVVSVQGLAAGSSVTTGMHLMDVIPEGDRLLIDVQVAPHLIDRVHPGLSSDIRINAFPGEPQLVISGQVASVSSDQLHQPGAVGAPYYLARLEVTAEGREQLGQRKLRPGMPVDVVIKTGERSFMSYLLKPLMRRVFSSFREI